MSNSGQAAAWLVLAVGDNRQHGGNDGYDDEPAVHYSWDNRVANHSRLKVGDAIALWAKRALIGVSVIEGITLGRAAKHLHSCPYRRSADIKERSTKIPRYRCFNCKREFETPNTRVVDVTTFHSTHDAGWVDLAGCLSGPELRALCEQPSSQLSLRGLRWDDFRAAVAASPHGVPLRVLDAAAHRLSGGHAVTTVRVRLGQASFRSRLLAEHGAVCAFSGPSPVEVLEAGHLYSYASAGVHRHHGGLLFRRDLHRLFDLGHIAVNPTTWLVDVSPEVAGYPLYRTLHHQPIRVALSVGHRRWLAEHWKEHRSAVPPALIVKTSHDDEAS